MQQALNTQVKLLRWDTFWPKISAKIYRRPRKTKANLCNI